MASSREDLSPCNSSRRFARSRVSRYSLITFVMVECLCLQFSNGFAELFQFVRVECTGELPTRFDALLVDPLRLAGVGVVSVVAAPLLKGFVIEVGRAVNAQRVQDAGQGRRDFLNLR